MLSFLSHCVRFCDGLTRRDFLRVGALAAGGLTWPDLLRAEATAPPEPPLRSIINIYLPGGPSHIDLFDLKPQAPSEIRGPFRPIATSVPGMQICEHLPKLARMAEKFALVRSITGLREEHRANQSDSGWPEAELQRLGGHPGLGAVVASLHGPRTNCPVTAVAMGGHTSPGFLGPSFKDFAPDGPGRANLRLQIPQGQLATRRDLLRQLDTLRRDVDASGVMVAQDRFTQQAMDVVTSKAFADALDIEREPAADRDKYGTTDQNTPQGRQNGRVLLARRLVEAGVRVVSLSWGGWDTHDNNFTTLRERLPLLDTVLSALLDDLDRRGLLERTLVMMSGEFGRTPRINARAGRDHWPAASFFFLAGGGLRTGQVIGATDRLGAAVRDRPVHLQQIFATVYRQLGIDVAVARLTDGSGRPQYLVDHRDVIGELV
jgi:hypothetical protein